MPIYDFSCTTCSERFDELQRFDAAPPACPACGGESERLLSPFLTPQLVGGERKVIRSVPSCLPSGPDGMTPGTGTHA